MAKERIIQTKEAAQAQLELNTAGAQFVDIIKDMKNELSKVTAELANGKAEMADMVKNTDKAEKLAKQLATADSDMLASKAKRATFEKNLTNALQEQQRLQLLITKYSESDNKSIQKKVRVLADQLQMSRELTKEAQKFSKEVRKAEKASNIFGGLGEIFGDIPVLGKVFDGFAKASKTMAEYQAKGHSASKGMGAAFKDIAKLGLATMVGMMWEGIQKIQQGAADIRRNLGMAGKDAAKAFSRAASAASSMALPVGEAAGSIVGFNKALKTSAVVSGQTSKYVLGIANRMGLGAEAAAGLYKHAALSGQSLKETADETLGFTEKFNAANKVFLNGAVILEDVATASARTALNTKKFPGGLKKAAAEARKLGSDLAKSEAAMSGMLDFESSLTAEMEAEVLLGRDLNLDKARLAALNGDIAGFNREINKQGITAASFGKMNMLQQEATAKALGMGAEELAERLKGEKTQKVLAKEAVANGQKFNTSQATAADLGAKIAQDAMFTATAAERIAAAFERIQLKLAGMALTLLEDVLPTVEKFVNFIVSSEEATATLIQTMAKVAVTSILAPFKAAKNVVTSVISLLKRALGMAGDVTKTASNAASSASAAAGGAGAAGGGGGGGGGGFFDKVKSFGSKIVDKGKGFVKGVKNAPGNIVKGAKNLGSNIVSKGKNMVEGAKNLVKNPFSALKKYSGKLFKGFGKFAKRVPILGTIIEGLLMNMDFKSFIEEGGTKEDIHRMIGKRTIQGVGGMMGGIAASAITSGLSATGIPTFLLNALAYAGGDFLGRQLGGYVADNAGGFTNTIGSGVSSVFGYDKDINEAIAAKTDKGNDVLSPGKGDVRYGSRMLAGPEGVISLNNKDTVIAGTNLFKKGDDVVSKPAGTVQVGSSNQKKSRTEELLQELISVVKAGGDITLDGRKVGTNLVMGASQL